MKSKNKSSKDNASSALNSGTSKKAAKQNIITEKLHPLKTLKKTARKKLGIQVNKGTKTTSSTSNVVSKKVAVRKAVAKKAAPTNDAIIKRKNQVACKNEKRSGKNANGDPHGL